MSRGLRLLWPFLCLVIVRTKPNEVLNGRKIEGSEKPGNFRCFLSPRSLETCLVSVIHLGFMKDVRSVSGET